ncbi:hypothetical protein FRC03_010666 [Tulasnella sp. 419]|nr:hypothetical protein FRC03_010666 [Tulasnella sp. 419]
MASSSTRLVALILGYGKGVGSAVAQKLKSEGLSVAVAGRSIDSDDVRNEGYLPVTVDLADAEAIPKAFEQVERELGPAALVLYNAYSLRSPQPADPLSLPFSDFLHGLSVTGVNAYVAAQQSLKGFDKLPSDVPKAFIVNGNVLPFIDPIEPFLSLGLGKKAARDIVQVAADAYGPAGKRFYFAYQVSPDGQGIAGETQKYWDLQAHADTFYSLWKQSEQGNWHVKFEQGGKLHVLQ